MPVHDFQFTPPQSTIPSNKSYIRQDMPIDNRPERVPNISIPKQPPPLEDPKNLSPERVREISTKGFYVLDETIQRWLSGIKVPIHDNYKVASVHVVSQDRSVMSWAQETFDGRVRLPIISLHRKSWSFDPTRYTPPYLPILKQFTDTTSRSMRLVYRPVPFIVEYNVAIWCEYKHDAEYIMTDIIRRSSPMATVEVEDEYVQQVVRITSSAGNNSSDIDIGAKERAKVIYEVPLRVEYSIPINEKIVPTILGRIVTIKETVSGEVLDSYTIGDY